MASDQPFVCPTCLPPDAEAAYANARNLDQLADLIDESHFMIDICACPRCAQRFISTFTEEVDWADSEDPQRRTLMPLTPAEADRLIAEREHVNEPYIESLRAGRPVLVMTFPKSGEKTYAYISGAHLIGPHD